MNYYAVGKLDPQREFECSIRPNAEGCEEYREMMDKRKLAMVLAGFGLIYAWQQGWLGGRS